MSPVRTVTLRSGMDPLKMVEAEGIAPSSKENLAVGATGLFHVLF